MYVIDAYRPVAGEITLAVMGFKCKSRPTSVLQHCGSNTLAALFGFLLSFYTNPWIDKSGYLDAYGAMAGIAAAVLIMWVPLYKWGIQLRHVTWHWPVISYIHWSDDREVGE